MDKLTSELAAWEKEMSSVQKSIGSSGLKMLELSSSLYTQSFVSKKSNLCIYHHVILECVSKCREMQFRADLAAFQGDFPQA